jgi:WD40 repeat protein
VTALFSPNGERFATCAESDECVRVWDRSTGRLLAVLPASTKLLRWSAFSEDGERLFLTGAAKEPEGGHEVWDVEQAAKISTLRGTHHAISRQGDRVVLECGPCLGIVNVMTGAVFFHLTPTLGKKGHAYCFSPDGWMLLTSSPKDEHSMLWRRRNADERSGHMYQPETWLTPLLAILLVWSIWRDRRTLYRREPAEGQVSG